MRAKKPEPLKPAPPELLPPPRFETDPRYGEPSKASIVAMICELEELGWVLEKMTEDVLAFRRGAAKSKPAQSPVAPVEAPKDPAEPPRMLVGAEGISEEYYLPVSSPEPLRPNGPTLDKKAPPAATSAPETPKERVLPEEMGGDEEEVPLEGQKWKVSAVDAVWALDSDEIRMRTGYGACCKDASLWPPSAWRPEKEACHWLGAEGCTLSSQDRPVACHLYPLALDKSGALNNHKRDSRARTGIMAIEALKDNLTALFGESAYAAALQSVREGRDYEFAVPARVAAAMRREVRWARANAIPVPRTLFDAGNVAALDGMPQDKAEASMKCLDAAPKPKAADEVVANPAPSKGIQVGEMDEDGQAQTDSPARVTIDGKEVVGVAIETHGAVGQAIAEEFRKHTDPAVQGHTHDGPTADGAALQGVNPPRTANAADIVLDFETPVEIQPLSGGGHVYVKRDDLFGVAGVNGGKARTCWALATRMAAGTPPLEGLLTAGSRMSPQCNIVAHIARRLGVPCRLHIPWAKKPLEGELAEAASLEAEIVEHKAGRNTVIVARAREDAAARPTWGHIPFSMDCQEAVEQTRKQAHILKRYGRICGRIVVPVGSGMTLAGILWGMNIATMATIPVVGVCMGADPKKRLDRYAPRNWRASVTLHDAPGDYHDPADVTQLGDLELDPIYEAKCLPFLKPNDLLWVVGIRNCVS